MRIVMGFYQHYIYIIMFTYFILVPDVGDWKFIDKRLVPPLQFGFFLEHTLAYSICLRLSWLHMGQTSVEEKGITYILQAL